MNAIHKKTSIQRPERVQRFTVYLPSSIDKEVREVAKRDERPLSWHAEKAFRLYLATLEHRLK